MAERQLTLHWMRKYLPSIIAGIVLTTVTVQTITVQDSITIDSDGDITIDEDGITRAAGALDLRVASATAPITIANTGGGATVTVSSTGLAVNAGNAGDDIEFVANDTTEFVTQDFTVSGGDEIYIAGATAHYYAPSTTIYSTAGNDFVIDTTGVTIDIDDAGDDITMTTVDVATIATDTGGQMQTTTGGVNILASSTGDDIVIDAADALTLDGTTVSASAANGGTAYRIAPTHNITLGSVPGSTAETLAASALIEAGALVSNGRGLEIEVRGTAAGNTNNKTVRIELSTAANTSGSTVAQCNFNSANDSTFWLRATVFRSGSNTQYGYVTAQGGTATAAGTHCLASGSTSLTDSSAMYAVVTVQNSTSAADLTAYFNRFTWL